MHSRAAAGARPPQQHSLKAKRPPKPAAVSPQLPTLSARHKFKIFQPGCKLKQFKRGEDVPHTGFWEGTPSVLTDDQNAPAMQSRSQHPPCSVYTPSSIRCTDKQRFSTRLKTHYLPFYPASATTTPAIAIHFAEGRIRKATRSNAGSRGAVSSTQPLPHLAPAAPTECRAQLLRLPHPQHRESPQLCHPMGRAGSRAALSIPQTGSPSPGPVPALLSSTRH